MTQRVFQLVHTLSYGDAISSEVLALRHCFEKLGFESEVYAINVHPKLKGQAKDFESFPKDFCGEVLLHYSLGSPLNDLYRNLTSAKRALIYHNLTPSHWFEGVNPRIVRDIQEGERELPELLGITDRILADSPFNASELQKLGFEAQVLELSVDPGRWNIEANSGIAQMVRSEGGIHLLHVGRLAPNKCIEDIIRTFYFLHHYIEENSRLWLVGIDIDTELYSFSLRHLVHQLGLEDAVSFVGCMADSEVRALYENASVYVCMSEHEGFCLPVIEAMHFGLPVVSFASSALPDTIGSGGVLVHEKRPAELAELLAHVARDATLRAHLISQGKKRVAELSFERFFDNVSLLFSQSDGQEKRASAI
ncbi:MAG: glycosyltransferase family 4 protein [Bdellovibrionales bacterium]|nr:glycosyltransferase family 4 protein [Bdellovibrionales bacterium]